MKTKAKQSQSQQVQVLELKERLARALADYDNLRKRTEEETRNFERVANARFVKRLLPVIDLLEEAQKHLNDSGIAITIKEFKEVLKQEGFEEIRIEPEDEFDQQLHEVIEVVEKKGARDGSIATVALNGWRLVDGGVIRHAKVGVYKNKE